MNKRLMGVSAERFVRNYLLQNEYEILEQNFYTKHGEIDIIAKKDGQIRFIEVKARSNLRCGGGAEAVNRKKQQALRYAAAVYITSRQLADYDFHFDVAEVYINVISDAF